MKVIISQAVILEIEGTPNAIKLHELLNHVCRGRHILLLDPHTALDSWLNTVDSGSRENYKSALHLATRSATSLAADTATIKVAVGSHQPQWENLLAVLNIDDTLAVLNEPLGIMLENTRGCCRFT